MLIADQLRYANSDVFGQGILELVREKSVKSQGILLSLVCGNPDMILVRTLSHNVRKCVSNSAHGLSILHHGLESLAMNKWHPTD